MVQYNPNVQGSNTGSDLVNVLTEWESALMSSNSGTDRPENIVAGGIWVKIISSTSWQLVLYDGTNDLVIASINPDNSTITFDSNSLTGSLDADTLNGASNYNKFRTGGSDPNGSVQGVETGELYYDTTNRLVYFYSGTGTIWNKLSPSNVRTLINTSETELISDQTVILDATSNSIDFNLLASNSNNEGKIIELKRVDTVISNEVRINPNGSETISGLSQIKLRRKGESVKILSRNNNREILDSQGCSLTTDGLYFLSEFNGSRASILHNGNSNTIIKSNNISSVSRPNTGYFVFYFTENMPTADYEAYAIAEWTPSGGPYNVLNTSIAGKTVSSVQVYIANTGQTNAVSTIYKNPKTLSLSIKL